MKTPNRGRVNTLIAIFIICIFVLSSCSESKSDMFVTPYGFKGRVTIIYGDSGGEQQKHLGKRTVFEIPSNGILRTKSTPCELFLSDPKYYYRSKTGKLVQMMNLDIFKTDPTLVATSLYPIHDSLCVENLIKVKTVLNGETDSVNTFSYSVTDSTTLH